MFRNLNRLCKNVCEKNSRLKHTIVELKELKLKEFGSSDGVELFKSELKVKLNNGEVLVKLLAAPINPADINIIQGKYGVLPSSLPANIGNEGLFQVLDSNCDNLKEGDFVLPLKSGWGTWRSHAVEKSTNFFKLRNNLDKQACATLSVNPVTAFRMLSDFVRLKPGDTVIQNGANSGVGQAVIQIGKWMKVNVVNIVRKRERLEELEGYLRSLGAEWVFTEDELRKPKLTTELWAKIPRARLGLNCVGGKATSDLVRLLDSNSTLVTYGGMSKQPLVFNTADFIFKNLKCEGFWLTRWKAKHPKEFEQTLSTLCDLIEENAFKAPKCDEFRLDDFKAALDKAQTSFKFEKILFTI